MSNAAPSRELNGCVPVRIIPEADPIAAYHLLIPDGWGCVSRLEGVRTHLTRPFPLGLFIESDEPDAAAITITAARLPIQIRLEDYLRALLASEGWRIAYEAWTLRAGQWHLQITALRNGATCRRVTAFPDGGRVLMHSATARVGRWSTLDPSFETSAASFELLAPSGRTHFEHTPAHRLAGGTVVVPETWEAKVRIDTPSLGALDINLHPHGWWRGYVRIKARHTERARDLDDLLATSHRELESVGINPSRTKLLAARPQNNPEPDGLLGVFHSTADIFGSPGEAWYGYKIARGIEWSVVGLAPSLSDDRIGCLRTRGAFDLALETAGEEVDR